MLAYRGILVEQSLGGNDELDNNWVSPMIAYRGILWRKL